MKASSPCIVSFSVDPQLAQSLGFYDSLSLTFSNGVTVKRVNLQNTSTKLTGLLTENISNTKMFSPGLVHKLKHSGICCVWQLCLLLDCLNTQVWGIGKCNLEIIKDKLSKAGLSDSFMVALRFRIFKQVFGLSFSEICPRDKVGIVTQQHDLTDHIRQVVPEILQSIPVRTSPRGKRTNKTATPS